MKYWNLLPVLSASMPLQMAMDETLFRQLSNENNFNLSTPLFRFYYADSPWITVGYSQKDYRPNGIPVCRRLTGGGIVHHGQDIIFSIVARKVDHESFRSVRISYLKIHEAIKMGFEKQGCALRFYRCDEKLPKGNDCFRFPIATDLAHVDKKIAGGAQKRSAGVLLHQESIQIPSGIDRGDLVSAIKEGFQTVFEMQFKPASIDPQFLNSIRRQTESAAQGAVN